ncbi:cytochrome c oxidase subunit 3 [Kallotenue papyrolyticum]|uniref:cytochrome c oxidase subunit 3 n=1 Tax=Kallotenue papyrolyticum TaxID=1325125 RepID=UPI00049298AA|nr:cytochrome c oxidase subunit 3 [Kallotenue papyrolyticum]
MAEHTLRAGHVAAHFDDAEQQFDAARLGMWTFLATEVLFFGGLFLVYAIYRAAYPEAFAEGSHHLHLVLGAVNTGVLLCSSLSMALAVRAAQTNQRRQLILFLILTILFGAAFLGVKAYEYYEKYHDHLMPLLGLPFVWEGPHADQVRLFYGLYFAMTGFHALHMVIGIGVLLGLLVLSWRGWFSSEYYTPVEMVGLYWHFVDIVWVFLYPLLYLIHGA